jgi:hypothetical protein
MLSITKDKYHTVLCITMQKLSQKNFEELDHTFNGRLAYILRILRRESPNLRKWNMYNPNDAAAYVGGLIDIEKERLVMITELVIQ